MLNKIALTVLLTLFSSSVYAENANNTIEDKYAACEKAYDACLLKCEEKNSKVEECMSQCDEELYKCNQKVEELESK